MLLTYVAIKRNDTEIIEEIKGGQQTQLYKL